MAENQQGARGTMDDDDYDIIIEEAGVGDPTAFASIKFSGPNVPTKDAPLQDIKIKVAVAWPKTKHPHAISIGYVFINSVSNEGPYRFGLPYDDATFPIQVNAHIPLTMVLSVEATQNGKPVKFSGDQKDGGYIYTKADIIPKVYRDELSD